jgi:radical SAM protein with 4Fe4S-binding SPASM domain
MVQSTAHKIAHDLASAGWTPRIEFAMHGEPTLNPELHKLIWEFRHALPDASIMLTTNGDPLRTHSLGLVQAVDRLFAHGLNTLALDDYRGMRVAPLMRDYAKLRDILCYEYPDEPDGNPHKRWTRWSKRITIIRDISVATQGTHSHLSNHSGSAAPLNDSRRHERCALPFREMSIRWDGHVALCCNDWTGMFKVGNVLDTDIESIWQHPAFDAARKYLLHEGRAFRPCRGCDHRTSRNGLLPDKMGKEHLPVPTKADDQAIKTALAGASYTTPIVRKWEKPGAPLRTRVPLPMLGDSHE